MVIFKTFLIMVFVFLATYLWLDFGSSSADIEPDIMRSVTHNISEASPTATTNNAPSVDNNYILNVPTLGIKAPVIFESSNDDKKIYKSLEDGVVHFAGTPMPGDAGTAVILGHSSSYPWYDGRYGDVFANLSELKIGDYFTISRGEKVYFYKITKSLIFSGDNAQLTGFETSDNSSVVLMTCWPTGTVSKRLAVKADLVM